MLAKRGTDAPHIQRPERLLNAIGSENDLRKKFSSAWHKRVSSG